MNTLISAAFDHESEVSEEVDDSVVQKLNFDEVTKLLV